MRKILFIGLEYHDYTNQMVQGLKNLGYTVKFHSIKPRGVNHKLFQTLSKKYFQSFLDNYHSSIIEKECSLDYDFVFFLQVHYFSIKNLKSLRKWHKNSKFILYNWDSIHTHDYRKHIDLFDEIYTFDPDDAKNLDISYLPLFCVPIYQELEKIHHSIPTIYFVGNIATVKRYKAILEFKKYCSKEKIEFQFYMKCSPVVYYKLLCAGFFPLDVSFKNITKKKLINLVSSSIAVFDFSNHSQVGYTMRFMENLCAGKKIITMNKCALEDSFYTKDRILYFEDLNFSRVKKFMNTELEDNTKVFTEFYLECFLKKIFN